MLAGKSVWGKTRVLLLCFSPSLAARCRKAEACHLNPSEAALFSSMSRYDRAHSLLVAGQLKDDETLTRAALLHDAGKLRAELPAWFRTGYTMAEILAPRRLARQVERVSAEAGTGSCRERLDRLGGSTQRALFVQSHHGRIAAEILEGLGCELEVVRLVRYHQGVPGPEDAALTRFIRADSAF